MEQQVGWIIEASINKIFPGSKLTFPWNDFCHKLEKLQPMTRISTLCWRNPELGYLKLNTDGSFNNQNDIAGLERADIDENRQLVIAFSISSQCISHNIA